MIQARARPKNEKIRFSRVQKFCISISSILILGLTGYRVWRIWRTLVLERFGEYLPGCERNNKTEEFHVGNGSGIFLFSQLQPSTSNIFFIQSPCTGNRSDHLNLSNQQLCSIYSAAVQNPSKKVILLCTCTLTTDFILTFPSVDSVRTSLDLPNFHVVYKNRSSELFERVIRELVPNATSKVAYDGDAFKFLVIYMFGGTYMNMDSINIRPLDELGINFIDAESKSSIGGSFFNFEPKHGFLKELLSEMYSPAGRRTIDLVTSVLRKFCKLKDGIDFGKFLNFTQCDMKILAGPSTQNDSPGSDDLNQSSFPKVLSLPLEGYIIPFGNFHDHENGTREQMKKICPPVYNLENITGHYRRPKPDISRSAFNEDVFSTARKLSPSSNNVFFLETSCTTPSSSTFRKLKTNDFPILSARQACAIYSTAFYNPSREVILMYTCQGFANLSSGLVKKLFELPNFSMTNISLWEFYKDTLGGRMLEPLKKSEFPEQHHSDVLRLLVLYLYGGTYMDMDIISLRNLDDLGKNFIGAEDYQRVGNSVLSFEARHKLIKECLKDANHFYQPTMWSSVGPLLILSVLINRCGLEMNPRKNWSDWKPFREKRLIGACNVTVLPYKTFYAVPYWQHTRFYNDSEWPTVQLQLQPSYVAHFWNHMGPEPVYLDGEQPYAKLAKQHCSPIFDYVRTEGCFFLE